MSEPLNLVAIIGSLRAESANRAVYNAATQLLDREIVLTEVPLSDVPLYDGDIEAAGDPPGVVRLKESVAAADGLIVFTPEYNRSVPAVTKNAIDWLSRLPGSSVLSQTTVGVVAATPGGHDAQGVRTHLSASIVANTDRFHGATLGLGSIFGKITDGVLTDPDAVQQLDDWLGTFAAFAREQRDG